jgi:glycosyltransferase involved in cell wall biosynthesis
MGQQREPMRIAIDTVLLLSPLTGVGQYAYQIARNLRKVAPFHDYTYFYGYYSSRLLAPGEHLDSVHRVKEAVRKIPILGNAARSLKDVANLFSSREFDLYFEPNFIPLNIRARRTVVTVPDFSFVRFPQWHTCDKVRYYAKNFLNKIRRAQRIIVISDFIRNEAIQSFGFSPEKLTTIHPGVDREIYRVYDPQDLLPTREKYRLPENFILFVGSLEPRKNLERLLLAYQNLEKPARSEVKLVLAGFKGWENERIVSLIRNMKTDVFYLGYLPQEDLAKIYNLARLFIYPSLYEGFGLPPLEAMACGCPVIVSHAASLPEVCGEGAFYVNPCDVGSIARGIDRVLKDEGLRILLASKGRERASQFSWEKSARAHLKLFEEIFPS